MEYTGRTRARWIPGGRLSAWLLVALSLGLPLALVLNAVFAARELNEMRAIYLRDRAAHVAARLEVTPAAQLAQGDFESLLESDPALLSVRVFRPEDPDGGNSAVADIRAGRELYRTGEADADGQRVFRAYVPFHSALGVCVAQIDLSLAAPDFILVHARRTVEVAVAGGTVLLLVSLYAIWIARRAARLEQERLRMENLAHLGTLSAVLAHEIRNPLGAIKGFAQLARESAGPAGAKPLDAIVRESRRLENLVNSLLLYGRQVQPVPRSTTWEAVAGELGPHVREAIGARPIRYSAESGVERFSTDPDLLKQVLLNLIRNSVEALAERGEGEIRLRARAGTGGAVVISVEDDGPGIPKEVRDKEFAPFVTTKASGTGLGLSISKKVVEALGGRLRLLPVEPHGTRAELELHGTNSHS